MGTFKLNAASVPDKAGPAIHYKTREYAEQFVRLLHRWRDNERLPLFVTATQTGMSPASIRQAFYHARTYMRENAADFDAADLELANGVSFELRTAPIKGVVLLRAAKTMDFVAAAGPISLDERDDSKYHMFLEWLQAEREVDDKLELAGPFTLEDVARYQKTLEELRGVYLSRITPQQITVIYHPGGK